MNNLIYSLLYVTDDTPTDFASLAAMAQLWSHSIRTLGKHTGRLILLSNVKIDIADCEVHHLAVKSTSELKRSTDKVFVWDQVPWSQFDSLMYMDLDMVAMAPLEPMFATDQMRVAASSHPTTWDYHAGRLLPRSEIEERSKEKPQLAQEGVSACLYSLPKKSFASTMKTWSDTILNMSKDLSREDKKHFGDQSYLNCAYFREEIKASRYGALEVQHRSHQITPEAKVFHFPSKDKDEVRLALMRKYINLANDCGPTEP